VNKMREQKNAQEEKTSRKDGHDLQRKGSRINFLALPANGEVSENIV
jgi:hypothetical protein